MIIFAGLLLVLWLLGFVFLFRVPNCRPLDPAAAIASLSLIIPARNEEANLPQLLRSLDRQDFAPAEIIVVDDSSEDATAALARFGGATVINSRPLPPGWRGKTWACWRGARAARGETLLFLDADTELLPGGLRRLAGEFSRRGGAISLLPYHSTRKPYEQFSAFFNIMMAAGVGAFTVLGRRRVRQGLFGQSLIISRGDYFLAGGHEKVRERILENLFMAENLRRSGIGIACLGGRGVLAMRPYPGGLRELTAGWSKAFAAGAARTAPWLLVAASLWIGGALLAFSALFYAALASGPLYNTLIAGVLYLCYATQIYWMLRRLGDYSPFTALFYPLALFFYLGVFSRSLLISRRGGTVEWRGRRIQPGSEEEIQ